MNLLAKPLQKFEILLVEDNPADARLFSFALKGFEEEHNLRVITDGQLAMDFIQKRESFVNAPRPDVIVLDWKLPSYDGRELLKKIREDFSLREIPVVVLSGADPAETLQEAYGGGANLFIEKPITLDRFSFILQYLVEVVQKKGEAVPPDETQGD
jgi:chemotaxis family two-component system response regulator Rcp1